MLFHEFVLLQERGAACSFPCHPFCRVSSFCWVPPRTRARRGPVLLIAVKTWLRAQLSAQVGVWRDDVDLPMT
jgi:hypothetical protein